MVKPIQIWKKFTELESSSGLVLVLAAIVALVLINSPWKNLYYSFISYPLGLSLGAYHFSAPLLLWVNDGLMVLFFLVVGLEIKREILEGHLAKRSQIILPGAAALGGMFAPAVIYLLCVGFYGQDSHGWAIPSATDIAFSLAALSLVGKRVPISLKVFLTAVAIFDDLGAIVVIALFYTKNISFLYLSGVAVVWLILWGLNRYRITILAPYLILGAVLWLFLLFSGVHATLAGVLVALTIPAKGKGESSPLRTLETKLHPWVAFGIVPLFGLTNAGVELSGLSSIMGVTGITLGITLGLFLGKQIGIMGCSWLLVQFRLAKLPEGATWTQFYGISLLCGIGFTMSLFIGTLSFDNAEQLALMRIGVIAGSLLSATAGYLVLMGSRRKL